MRSRRLVRVAAAVGLLTVLVACGTDEGEGSADDRAVPSVTAATPTQPTTQPTTPPRDTGADQEASMRIEIRAAGQSFSATLDDSQAARDLVAQLPVTIEMRDHGGVEKTGRLPGPLSLEGQPEGADPDVGAVGYYAPGQDLVLYYGDQSYFPGIVVLGRLDDDAARRLAGVGGSLSVDVDLAR